MALQSDFLTVAPSGSDSHWRVASSLSPILLLSASQDQRSHAAIFNHSNASLYVKFGGNAGMANTGSLGVFDHKITSGTLYDLPKPIWQGEVWGVWDGAGGWAMVHSLGKAGS